MNPLLIVRTPAGLRREFHLATRSITVGRGPDCDLVLDSRQVSRLHARIEPAARDRTIADCGSTNGTYVNGVLIEEQRRLGSGDVIAVGDIFLTFLDRGEGGLLAALERASTLLGSTQSAQRRHGLWLVDDVIEIADDLGDSALTQRAVTLKMTAMGSGAPSAKGEGGISTTLWIGRPDLRAMSAPAGKVAVMITDMEGSTPLTEQLGDERWMEYLRDYSAIVRRHVSARGGFEVKSTGDGSMIVFQEAEAAVLAAVAMQRDFDAFNRAQPDLSLRIRIGIHLGEVIREGDDFFGKAVVIATRVTSAAVGGEILVSEAVEESTQGSTDIQFGERRLVALKGLPGEHAVAPVRW